MEAMDFSDSEFEFTLAEIVEMETIYKEIGVESLDQEFCQRLATSFSCSSNRMGKTTVTWDQVHAWFQEKQSDSKPKLTSSSMALKLFVDLSGPNISNSAPQSFKRRSSGDKVKDLSELQFEARSSRDNAWYDVASFLTYRVLCTGELEARVRFAGFGNAHDEWVSVRTDVRERSIPLEPSECDRVKVGDIVMCFQDRGYQAVYRDAHIVEIQRQSHDNTRCTCIFVVQYYHDNSEENVRLERICCRPSE
ncbi:hypothetical protein SLA2020_076570 [Shorea laevis]